MDFTIELDDKIKLNNPILLIGLPGIGLVGKIAIEYIAQNTKAKKIGSIHGSVFPPLVIVDKKGNVDLIKDEIYLLKQEKNDLILLTGDVQPPIGNPLADEHHYYFAKKIIEIAKKIGVNKIYTFAGMDIGDARITQKPKIQFAANSEKEIVAMKKLKLIQAKEDLTISGVAGVVVGLAKQEKIDAACILGETSSKLIYGDFDSARAVLEFTCNMLKINIDLKDIKKEASKITKAFKQIVDELKSISEADNKEEPRLTYTR